MNKKHSNFELLIMSTHNNVSKLKNKAGKLLMLSIMCFASTFVNAQQNLKAVDDYATTGPMQKVRVNVLVNDTLTCSNYTLTVLSSLNPVTQGTATVANGGFIEFMPGLSCRNTNVNIVYGLTCNGVQVTANLTIHVTQYNKPVNVIDKNVECYDNMESDINFGIHLKYQTSPRNSDGNYIDAFTSPLVGDLNGDGKPEIIIMGNNGSVGNIASTELRYISIYNG